LSDVIAGPKAAVAAFLTQQDAAAAVDCFPF